MAKIIAAINMTLDGYCDHTAVIPDDSMVDHFTALLKSADLILYGRITYQLMEDAWPELVKNPSGEKSADDFAVAIDQIPKLVFSRTLKTLKWDSATLADQDLEAEVVRLKQQPGKTILVGCRSLIPLRNPPALQVVMYFAAMQMH